jgi:hypothetical protein
VALQAAIHETLKLDDLLRWVVKDVV